MARFLDSLDMRLLVDATGSPLLNRSGRQLYQLLARFRYQSDIAGLIEVPAGYVTDLASLPQAMLSIFGEIAQEPSVAHDFAYSTGIISRCAADMMLREACLLTKIPKWKCFLIFWGVRMGGRSHYVTREAGVPDRAKSP